jgi:hypothetical protein
MAKEKNKTEIKKAKLILVEGADALYFFIYLLESLAIQDVQVLDYGGITNLTQYLKNLVKYDGYQAVTSILILRDAEFSSEHSSESASDSAVKSIKSSLQKSNFIQEDNDIETFKLPLYEYNRHKIGIGLFPGLDDKKQLIPQGTLEELCLKIFEKDVIVHKIFSGINTFLINYLGFKRSHKNKLHTVLSFTDKYVGMKIGETARAKGFNFDSPYLSPFIDMIRAL